MDNTPLGFVILSEAKNLAPRKPGNKYEPTQSRPTSSKPLITTLTIYTTQRRDESRNLGLLQWPKEPTFQPRKTHPPTIRSIPSEHQLILQLHSP
jgi:hypothetical protein